MRVPSEGHGYGGVPEEVLDLFRVDSSTKEQRGARVCLRSRHREPNGIKERAEQSSQGASDRLSSNAEG